MSKYMRKFTNNDFLSDFYQAVENAFDLVENDNETLKINNFQPNTAYVQGQIIIYNNNFYQALNNFTSSTDFNEADWIKLASGVESFIDLIDTPSTFSENSKKFIRVNETEDGLEFSSISFVDLDDVPTFTGQAGKVLAVNQTEDGLEFITPSSGGGSVDFSKVINIFAAGTTYPAGSYVLYKNCIFKALTDTSATPDPSATTSDWEIIFNMFDDTGSNIALGKNALSRNNTNYYSKNNIAIGKNAGLNISSRTGDNIIIGTDALSVGVNPSNCIAIGNDALKNYNGNIGNIAIGDSALFSVTDGSGNIAIGNSALFSLTDGSGNLSIGTMGLYNCTTGSLNRSIGGAGYHVSTGSANILIGDGYTFRGCNGNQNVIIGHQALNASFGTTRNNNIALGFGTWTTGDNQVQLGDSRTTTYVYGTVQNRSDKRDKADIEESDLGLDFIMRLKPVKFRWNMREDYIDIIEEQLEVDISFLNLLEEEKITFLKSLDENIINFNILNEDKENNKVLLNISKEIKNENDGSRKRKRFHYGLIAQDIEELIANGIIEDFGGYQNHLHNGGEDVKTIGYDEFISPIIKAMQELKREKDNEVNELKNEIELLKKQIAELRTMINPAN